MILIEDVKEVVKEKFNLRLLYLILIVFGVLVIIGWFFKDYLEDTVLEFVVFPFETFERIKDWAIDCYLAVFGGKKKPPEKPFKL